MPYFGVARGESALVSAPTSTGKTQIAIWAVCSWMARHPSKNRAVYLVTHRSLANQKFEEFTNILLDTVFNNSPDSIVLATGDRQEDTAGNTTVEPQQASLLIATYEKFLGLLCTSGIPSDMGDLCVICDEVQILGDRTRGVNVETLLTLIRNASTGQFVGLSAVLTEKDATQIADWLGVKPIRVPVREKDLVYECRTPNRCFSFSTATPGTGITERTKSNHEASNVMSLVHEVMGGNDNKPVVVFCMRKQDVYDGCKKYCKDLGISLSGAPLLEGLSADTPEAALLSATIPHGIAFHCADLVENDRVFVENALFDRRINIVFATSTLAAGVNFPLGTVVFYAWKTWNFQRKRPEPIPPSEFHNMAGRCGRMGAEHETGKVFLVSTETHNDLEAIRTYLNPDHFDSINSQIEPSHFTHLILQLAASNVVNEEQEALRFLKSTFGASREHERNASGLEHWNKPFSDAIGNLRGWGFLR